MSKKSNERYWETVSHTIMESPAALPNKIELLCSSARAFNVDESKLQEVIRELIGEPEATPAPAKRSESPAPTPAPRAPARARPEPARARPEPATPAAPRTYEDVLAAPIFVDTKRQRYHGAMVQKSYGLLDPATPEDHELRGSTEKLLHLRERLVNDQNRIVKQLNESLERIGE